MRRDSRIHPREAAHTQLPENARPAAVYQGPSRESRCVDIDTLGVAGHNMREPNATTQQKRSNESEPVAIRLLGAKCIGTPFEKMDKQARVKELWRETNPDRFADKLQGNPTIRQFLDRVERQARPIHKGVTDPDERWAAAIVEQIGRASCRERV